MAPSTCVSRTQYSASWSHGELHRRPQWHRPHASPESSTAPRGPMGDSTEGPSGTVRMRLPHPVQRFLAPWGAPPNTIPTIAVLTTGYGWVLRQAGCVAP
eukprot:7131848-Pyramimonas_sp.AAC.1